MILLTGLTGMTVMTGVTRLDRALSGPIYEQKMAALEALKKSLLHQAFSGRP